LDASASKEHRSALRDVNANPPLLQPSLVTAEIQFPVAEKQHWHDGRDYDGRVTRVQSQLHVATGDEHVIDIQTKEDGGN
jgi:hypothetical protein